MLVNYNYYVISNTTNNINLARDYMKFLSQENTQRLYLDTF